LPDANDARCSDVNPFSWHPEYETDCADAMAYFEAIRLRRNLAERIDAGTDKLLVKGEALAREYHCFQCHGQLGQGGFRNERSFKGYVPGYFGSDFEFLTRDGSADSVRDWITHGMDSTMVDQPVLGRIAAYFFGRQAVSMPSYATLAPGEIEVLVNYVITLHEFGPMTAEGVRAYGERSVSIGGLVYVDRSTVN
jgi:mono/diheme cytochrome c family protein